MRFEHYRTLDNMRFFKSTIRHPAVRGVTYARQYAFSAVLSMKYQYYYMIQIAFKVINCTMLFIDL